MKAFVEPWRSSVRDRSGTDYPGRTSTMTIANEKTSASLLGTPRPCKISGAVQRAVPSVGIEVSSAMP